MLNYFTCPLQFKTLSNRLLVTSSLIATVGMSVAMAQSPTLEFEVKADPSNGGLDLTWTGADPYAQTWQDSHSAVGDFLRLRDGIVARSGLSVTSIASPDLSSYVLKGRMEFSKTILRRPVSTPLLDSLKAFAEHVSATAYSDADYANPFGMPALRITRASDGGALTQRQAGALRAFLACVGSEFLPANLGLPAFVKTVFQDNACGAAEYSDIADVRIELSAQNGLDAPRDDKHFLFDMLADSLCFIGRTTADEERPLYFADLEKTGWVMRPVGSPTGNLTADQYFAASGSCRRKAYHDLLTSLPARFDTITSAQVFNANVGAQKFFISQVVDVGVGPDAKTPEQQERIVLDVAKSLLSTATSTQAPFNQVYDLNAKALTEAAKVPGASARNLVEAYLQPASAFVGSAFHTEIKGRSTTERALFLSKATELFTASCPKEANGERKVTAMCIKDSGRRVVSYRTVLRGSNQDEFGSMFDIGTMLLSR